MRVVAIGLAGVGRKHVETWKRIADVELVGVCDVIADVATDVGSRAGVPAYTNVETMFNAVRPNAVSLGTPPKTHLALTRFAAERGAHVFCEKPMASSVADCRAMIETCAERGVTLMIGHKKRFVPTIVRLKELTEGDLGSIEYLIHRYPHPGMSERDWFWAEDDGGGPLLENAVHAADTLGYLMGDVERVFAEGGVFFARKRAPQLNCAVYTLRFVSGSIATVGAGMVSTPAFNFEDFYAVSENGVAEVSGGFDNPNHLRYGYRATPRDAVEETLDADPFLLEMEHFVACARANRVPRADGDAGMKAVAVCRAVKLSAQRVEPVYVSELLDEYE
jgi:predicted dehydrogenase